MSSMSLDDYSRLSPDLVINAVESTGRLSDARVMALNSYENRVYQVGIEDSLPPLRLSSARTRWGSCSHHGGIALNWRLIFMPLAIVDYVVAHELAHLKEMNHSPRFWSVVEQLCPDWKTRRLELRRLAPQIPKL